MSYFSCVWYLPINLFDYAVFLSRWNGSGAAHASKLSYTKVVQACGHVDMSGLLYLTLACVMRMNLRCCLCVNHAYCLNILLRCTFHTLRMPGARP